MNTSFQFGGALVLAVVAAVNNAAAGPAGSAPGLLDGFRSAVIVSVVAAVLGVAATTFRRRNAAAAGFGRL